MYVLIKLSKKSQALYFINLFDMRIKINYSLKTSEKKNFELRNILVFVHLKCSLRV